MFRSSLRSAAVPLRNQLSLSCFLRQVAPSRRIPNSSARANGSYAQAVGDEFLLPVDPPVTSIVELAQGSGSENNGEPSDSSGRHEVVKTSAVEETMQQRDQPEPKQQKAPTPSARSRRPARRRTTAASKKRGTSRLRKDGAPSLRLVIVTESTKTSHIAKKPPLNRPPISRILACATSDNESGTLDSKDLSVTPLDMEVPPVPRLSYGLERVLFNPGVYHLRDPRSRVYNFDPYLGSIMPVTEFDFTALKEYITSSKDDKLREVAQKEGKKYIGSSSSMTTILCHFHYLLSAWREINVSTISQGFPAQFRSFTRLLRAPAAMFLHYQDGVYAIDADKEFDSANILMNLGKSMEKLLTLPKDEFERYRRSSENKISAKEEQAIPEAYHYSTFGDFLMRSQLDAYDPRLPGSGMFDLKTRAVVSIRMNAKDFEQGLGYQIRSRFGKYESYERELYDMIRAAFLKYSLQVRIGRMDGIFVAFHNIQRIFGFQYVSLPELDHAIHGQYNTALGDAEFHLSLALWQKILDRATAKFPQKSLRFHFDTGSSAVIPYMRIFVEPVTKEEIHAIQTKNKAAIDAYQQRLLNLPHLESENDSARSSSETKLEDDLPDEEDKAGAKDEAEPQDGEERELIALGLVIRNKLNGKPVERPSNVKPGHKWTVDYELVELGDAAKARTLYQSCQKRRRKALAEKDNDETKGLAGGYMRGLHRLASKGRRWREHEDALDRKYGIVVLDDADTMK